MEEDWGQNLVDPTKPNVARVYDFYLGGKHNFPADQQLAAQVIGAFPTLPDILRINRDFLRSAVTHMCAQGGIRQFLDLGAGLPTEGAVHEVAQAIDPTVRVVYVDIDPVAVLHTKQILSRNPLCAALCADYNDINGIFTDPTVTTLLDMSKPIGVLSLATLYFIDSDDDVRAITRAIYDRVAPGSLYAVTHGSKDAKPEQGEQVETLYRRNGNAFHLRTRQQIADLITPPWQITPPGLVPMAQWKPDTEFWPPQPNTDYALIAAKPTDPRDTAA